MARKPRMPRLTNAPTASPKKTQGAKHRSAPSAAHLSKRTLKRSDSAPSGTHSRRNPINNLGGFAFAKGAKLPTGRKIGAKSVADQIKSKSGKVY